MKHANPMALAGRRFKDRLGRLPWRFHRLALLTCALILGRPALADPDSFDAAPNTERAGQPMPAELAASSFTVPPGFTVGVFAAEPAVRNPIAMCWDVRGRLWVAENYTYAELPARFDLSLADRILIFEDRNGDGRADGRTVFIDSLRRLTSVEVGLGGVWALCPPQLVFIADQDGDDVPDSPPEVMLDGFAVPQENHHGFANGLKWGPDGWLYGRCGASAPGLVRPPALGPEAAVPIRGGLWRFHPGRKIFEVLCHGTTNPWGHDWNDLGEAFFVNSVNGHLWHLIPGAHFRRSHTISPNPLVYEPMEMHADHWHFDTSKGWVASREVTSEQSDLGGGHAHCGAMIYLGAQWPEEFHDRLLTLNLHGRRANVERLERHQSGYVARRQPDTLLAADPFFRGTDLGYGPDGSVVLLDWSDAGECHEHNGVHRQSGRIYHVHYGGEPAFVPPNLRAASLTQLAGWHSHPNAWFARQARREAANRLAAGRELETLIAALRQRLTGPAPPNVRLRCLWTLATLGQADHQMLVALLDDRHESLRAWALRLLTDDLPLDTVLGTPRPAPRAIEPEMLDRLRRMAATDSSGLVRLVLASTLQRLPVAARPALAAALAAREADAQDPNLPNLIWYGLIPLARQNPEALTDLVVNARMPRLRRSAARYLADRLSDRPELLDRLLARAAAAGDEARLDLLQGMSLALAGLQRASAPASWPAFAREPFAGPMAKPAGRLVRELQVVFGGGRALEEVRALALSEEADLSLRMASLASYIQARPPDLREVCLPLLKVRFLNTVALRGLATIDDPEVGAALARNYKSFHPSERGDVVETLAARRSFAKALLEAIGAGTIPAADVSAAQVRQIRELGDAALTERLAAIWGSVRDAQRDKQEQIALWRSRLNEQQLARANRSNGRAVYNKVCADCHRLFGSGGEAGPDLTGAGRKDLDYLLLNVIDPSAVVSKDFQVTLFGLADGRVLTGVVLSEGQSTITLQTAKQPVVFAKSEVESRRQSDQSLMPEGLLHALTEEQVRDLVSYLMSDAQVPLASSPE